MDLLQKLPQSTPTIPQPLFVSSSGKRVNLHIEEGTTLADLNRLHQIAATVFVEQGYNADSATIVSPAGPNPMRRHVLQITLTGDSRNPDLAPLMEIVQPTYRYSASLSVHPGKLLHYKMTLPAGKVIDSRRIFKLVNGPKGHERRGSMHEFWLTQATTHPQLWLEAQAIADLAGVYLTGEITQY